MIISKHIEPFLSEVVGLQIEFTLLLAFIGLSTIASLPIYFTVEAG